MPSDDDVRISYTARELLERMDAKIDTGFREVKEKLDDNTTRITTLENVGAGRKRMRQEVREALIVLGTVIMAVGSAVGIVHGLHL